MSIEYKAKICRGFELSDNWNKIVTEEFFEEHVDNFVEVDQYRAEGPQLFAVVLDSVENGDYTEYSTYMSLDDQDLLQRFITEFPGAAVDVLPSMYLVGTIA